MKCKALILLVVSLHGLDAYGVCNPTLTCIGSSLNVVTNCCAICDGNPHNEMPYPSPCTQATDDTCSINLALAAVSAAGGGEVIIPPGMCIVSPTVSSLKLGSNLTIRGAGAKSVIKVHDNIPNYDTIFAPASGVTLLSNVVIKDFRVDQNPSSNTPPTDGVHVLAVHPGGVLTGASGITVSGMFFDPTVGAHTIHLENPSDLRATITNNYFNFSRAGGGSYSNAAVYLEGSQQIVIGNTFFSTLNQYAGTAIE